MSIASAPALLWAALFLAPALADTELEARRIEVSVLHRALDLGGLQMRHAGRWQSRPPAPARLTVLHFWAVECKYCVAELPRLRDIAAAFRGERDLQFLFVTETEEDDELRTFLILNREAMPQSPVYRDTDDRLRRALGTSRQPLTLLLDREGTVRQAFVGPVETRRNELVDSIERLLRVLK